MRDFVIDTDTASDDAVAAPRLHTDGSLDLTLERKWPEAEADVLKKIGYNVKQGASANAHAIFVDPENGAAHYAAR